MVKISIIGSGGISRHHVESLKRIGDAQVISTCDVDNQRAAELAASCGAVACTDWRAGIKEADLVYILTPPSFHKDIAIEAMEEGKHVMIEKPIAIAEEDAEQIVEASHRLGRKAMVGFNMRHRTAYGKLKAVLDSGRLGDVLNYWSQRMGMGSQGGTWRTNRQQMSGFTIESLSHDIDIFRWLSGSEVECVYGNVANSRLDLPGYDDNTLAVLKLRNGQAAFIQASWSSYLEFNSRGIAGRDGTVMISGPGTWNFDRLTYRTKNMEEEYTETFADPLDGQSYYVENLHFVDCVLHDRKPQMTAEDGLAVLRVSRAILQSHRDNRMVTL
ncbi:Gfo/Idh/MocA family protein [Paenibacillus abyssi]|uniref:Oxidoreductase n=1 Tax=Paenibacillus abyssi TaxID=1340531 RepID=A0A917CY04_9BACL|nr:Gfo/Idh/MocA family oxidoreductase [Paenibacillus abyssi]GGG02321.1 oxidoreductase [Paenibacillus abyssi]